MSNYYDKYRKGQSSYVWNEFNKETGSKNFDDEKDSKKDNIGITPNDQKNIEDRYYGESNKTFDNDSKYFHPPSNSKSSSNWYIFALAIGVIGYISLKS